MVTFLEFVEAPGFTRHVGEYLDDAGLLALQLFLSDRPDAGQVMPGTGGFRKLRWGDQTRGKGKRGGLRVIYLYLAAEHLVWLFTLYGKDEADDLTPTQKANLRAAVEAELKHQQQQHVHRQGRNRVAVTKRTKRDIFGELMEGVSAMRSHREGRVTLRSHQI